MYSLTTSCVWTNYFSSFPSFFASSPPSSLLSFPPSFSSFFSFFAILTRNSFFSITIGREECVGRILLKYEFSWCGYVTLQGNMPWFLRMLVFLCAHEESFHFPGRWKEAALSDGIREGVVCGEGVVWAIPARWVPADYVNNIWSPDLMYLLFHISYSLC